MQNGLWDRQSWFKAFSLDSQYPFDITFQFLIHQLEECININKEFNLSSKHSQILCQDAVIIFTVYYELIETDLKVNLHKPG